MEDHPHVHKDERVVEATEGFSPSRAKASAPPHLQAMSSPTVNESGVPDNRLRLLCEALRTLENPCKITSQTEIADASRPPTPDGTGRPNNFQKIAPGLYRSSYPDHLHYETLAALELKTIITFVPEALSTHYANFISSCGITHHHIPILANKNPDLYTDASTVTSILELMLDATNYPMLIHCNKGKHRTGCMTACFRKACGWHIDAIIAEYVRYSTPKDRDLDKVFIERYDATEMKALALKRGYVGGAYAQPKELAANTAGVSETAWTMLGTSTDSAVSLEDLDEPDTKYNDDSLASSSLERASQYFESAKREHDKTMASTRLWSYK